MPNKLLKQDRASIASLRVLLIEDDLFDYQVIKRYFRGTPDVTLTHVESIKEAVEVLGEESFDCFLLDWHLPDGEGELFLTYAQDVVPWVPTLVMTSGMHDVLTEKALALGAQDYMLKDSFDSENLQRSIRYAIARKRAERERWSKIHGERMSFINEVVAGVAHEINNPVAWIHSNIGLLQMQLEQDEVEPSDAIELCKECAEGIERITSVLSVLRTYAEALDKTLDLCDVSALLSQCIKDVQQTNSWEIEVTLKAIASLPRVHLDRVAIHTALTHIILNAFQAASKSASSRCVEVHVSLAQRQLIVDVHDSGGGMNEAVAERIFDPFYSSQGHTNLGMGLAIARDVIISHRGAIEVKEASMLGGAWVRVRLPVL